MSNLIITTLLENGEERFQQVASVLIKIADNIVKHGSYPKYRSIRIDSNAFQEKLLPYEGAVQCLMEMGFQEDDDRFTFVDDTNLTKLQRIRDELHGQISKFHISPQVIQSQKEIRSRLKSHFEHSRIYENKSLQEKAKSRIPVQNLEDRAKRRLKHVKNTTTAPSYHHCLILELLSWFKKSFFTWTDAPKCLHCNTSQKPRSIGMLPPTREDHIWGAGRVEGYKCISCNTTLRFPRYNHPEKLLQTRTGRCGEWANCFTLVARAMGFESRHVLDWTDHVWTEVYIPEWERWIHCDPCENACDTPLVYEKGWKKKLSLIVAASAEELVDVTWRYSVDRDPVKQRRASMFNEQWLVDAIDELNRTLSVAVAPQRKRELVRRSEAEVAEMQRGKHVSDDELEGRTSGDLAWRLARGETQGGAGERRNKMVESSPIELSQLEEENLTFELQYSSAEDKYERVSNKEYIDGWEYMTWKYCDIMRKEELDWGMTYLCREEDSREGYISWKLLVPAHLCISQLQLTLSSSTFVTGVIGWLICSDTKCHVLHTGDHLFSSEYEKARSLSLHAFLRGGSGDVAWQKAQLFRQSIQDDKPSLRLVVKFKRKN